MRVLYTCCQKTTNYSNYANNSVEKLCMLNSEQDSDRPYHRPV